MAQEIQGQVVPAARVEAEKLSAGIEQGVEDAAEMNRQITAFVTDGRWRDLGYASAEAWYAERVAARMHKHEDARQQMILAFKAPGMSVRQTANQLQITAAEVHRARRPAASNAARKRRGSHAPQPEVFRHLPVSSGDNETPAGHASMPVTQSNSEPVTDITIDVPAPPAVMAGRPPGIGLPEPVTDRMDATETCTECTRLRGENDQLKARVKELESELTRLRLPPVQVPYGRATVKDRQPGIEGAGCICQGGVFDPVCPKRNYSWHDGWLQKVAKSSP